MFLDGSVEFISVVISFIRLCLIVSGEVDRVLLRSFLLYLATSVQLLPSNKASVKYEATSLGLYIFFHISFA